MRHRGRAIAVTATIVLAVAALSAAAYWQNYNSPESKCQREASAGDPGVYATVLTGSLTVQPGTDEGYLTMQVLVDGCEPFAGILVTAVQPALGGLVNQPFLTYDGTIVNAGHPVPTDIRQVSGSIEVTNAAADQAYSMNVTIAYGTSDSALSVSTQTFGLTSQS
jgi:hypothetical protein